jgi:GWxTD domain-containing protein
MSLPKMKMSLLAVFLLGLGWAAPARAQKLEKDDKKFLDDVRPIMLPDEEKTFKSLKDKADRQEFEKIFWARRDPNLETPANEYQAEYQKLYAEADSQYKVAGRNGASTDCGRVYILLGKPDEVKKEAGGESPMARAPETWTYRDRPTMTFQNGQIQIAFDGECRLPEGNKMGEQLDRLASNKIVQPNITAQVKDGKLQKKLADLLPKPTPAAALLKTPRQDFPMTSQSAFLKVQDGGTAILGLVRGGAAAGLPAEEVGGKKFVKVVVAAQALNEEGHQAGYVERQSRAEVQPDGSWVTSYRLIVRPGKYKIRAGAIDEKSNKGSVAEWDADVPNLNTGTLSTSGLSIIKDVEDVPANAPADSENPFSGYEMGTVRLVPRFGTNFTKADAVSFFYQYYDAQVDQSTGKPQVVASLKIQKVGKAEPVAKAPDQTFEAPIGGTVVGPVPLEKYDPGKYTALLKITDNVAKKDVTQEIPFEIQ